MASGLRPLLVTNLLLHILQSILKPCDCEVGLLKLVLLVLNLFLSALLFTFERVKLLLGLLLLGY